MIKNITPYGKLKKYGKIWQSLANSLGIGPNDMWRNSSWHVQGGGSSWGININGEEYFCFNTMTQCYKYGYTIDFNQFEIIARDLNDPNYEKIKQEL